MPHEDLHGLQINTRQFESLEPICTLEHPEVGYEFLLRELDHLGQAFTGRFRLVRVTEVKEIAVGTAQERRVIAVEPAGDIYYNEYCDTVTRKRSNQPEPFRTGLDAPTWWGRFFSRW
jgi:hypothetical protein